MLSKYYNKIHRTQGTFLSTILTEILNKAFNNSTKFQVFLKV